jgi:hypothetical protein
MSSRSTTPRSREKATQKTVAARPAAARTRVGRTPTATPSPTPASAPSGRPNRINHIDADSTRAYRWGGVILLWYGFVMIVATVVTTGSVASAMAASTNAPKPKPGWAIASRKKNGPAQRYVLQSIRAEPTFRSPRASTAPTGPPTLASAARTLSVNSDACRVPTR